MMYYPGFQSCSEACDCRLHTLHTQKEEEGRQTVTITEF